MARAYPKPSVKLGQSTSQNLCVEVLVDLTTWFDWGLLLPSHRRHPGALVRRRGHEFAPSAHDCTEEAIAIISRRSLF
jgi:hypothetical protein